MLKPSRKFPKGYPFITMPKKSSKPSYAANLGFEETLWAVTGKLRGNMDTSEYKHVVVFRVPIATTVDK